MARPVAVLVAVLLCCAGCGSARADSAWRSTAEDFATAVREGDAEAACRLLSTAAQDQLVAEHGSCEAGVLDSGLPSPGAVRETERFGTAARAVLDEDTYFLGRFGTRWLVTAAGCRPVPGAPFDCDLSGG
ncbi:hypothetical protein [Aeromicrobium sp. 179-A 4D2 NHS]|uniref:hypothetical protein n=1 Tax=Aeromicrobium sp. 179-A 4D2 NHS TaxID=3142375 RepID=UPI0039A37AD8